MQRLLISTVLTVEVIVLAIVPGVGEPAARHVDDGHPWCRWARWRRSGVILAGRYFEAVGSCSSSGPEEKVATDGVIVEGTSAVDASMLTDESVPVEAGPGDTVVRATVNAGGRPVVRATRVGADTQQAQMAWLVKGGWGTGTVEPGAPGSLVGNSCPNPERPRLA